MKKSELITLLNKHDGDYDIVVLQNYNWYFPIEVQLFKEEGIEYLEIDCHWKQSIMGNTSKGDIM